MSQYVSYCAALQFQQATDLIETLLELIKLRLASGYDVLISGFGKFCVREKRGGEVEIRLPVRVWC